MNYTKISELPVATTTASPDVVPIVQAGQTMQVDVGTLRLSPNTSFYSDLPDSKFIRGITADLNIGDNDVYTVPANRRALITAGRLWNDSGGNVTAFPEIKHGGTYYRIGSSTAVVGTGTGANMTVQNGMIFSAGDIFAINAATTAGSNALFSIIEFSDQSLLKPSVLYGTVSGDNTLYTVPADKTAMLVSYLQNFGGTFGQYMIAAGAVGAGVFLTKIVQSGGAPILTLTGGTSSANASQSVANLGFTLEAGDSVIINITTGDANQIIWSSFLELDA